MGRKLYKYIGPNILEKAFSKSGFCSLKCSYPKDYNDPYELFLAIDLDESPEMLAYYKETIDEIPQNPTTCFSNSPIVIPMWAHYAHSSCGIVIEFDEEKIIEHLADSMINDISYRDVADPEISTFMHHARGTGKPRHLVFYWKAVYRAAYFTKHTCWSYEQERRLVVSDEKISTENDNMVLYVPNNCVTAIISGSNVKKEINDKAKEIADNLSCLHYSMKIGKSGSIPFFESEKNEAFVFESGSIIKKDNCCESCNEPLNTEGTTCAWCSIEEQHIESASLQNAMRPLAATGILESYLKEFDLVGKKP